jgi:hypothetical protein
VVAAALESWEERPEVTRLLNRVALRVEHPEHRQVLTRAEPFRIFLAEATTEPPADPQLEEMILAQAPKRADAEAALDAVRRQLTSRLVELQKLRQRDPKADHAVLRAQVARLREDVQQARDAADRESGRLQQLLTIRANRRRAILLAESTK